MHKIKKTIIEQPAPNQQLQCWKYIICILHQQVRKSALIQKNVESQQCTKCVVEIKEWLRAKAQGASLHFCNTAGQKKKNIKAYIRRQKQLKRAFSPSQAKSTSQRVIFCARPDRNPVCVFLHRSANFGDSVEQISSHARTDEKTTLAQQDSETLPAGRPARGSGV